MEKEQRKNEGSKVSRRQFLTYTLTGVGGFMAATVVSPLVRFAVDPVLKGEAAGDFVVVAAESEITNEPKSFDFKVKEVDGWYKTEAAKTAWIYKDDNGKLVALSPICKHLGCTVKWNGDSNFQNEFFCPCHLGRYEKDGTNIKGTPPLAPLDRYDLKVEDGKIKLGKARPKGGK
ncbi:MAG: ubiquinol-cytochrome c reductase iron-sulfur subunit [Bacillaceae bacterium]